MDALEQLIAAADRLIQQRKTKKINEPYTPKMLEILLESAERKVAFLEQILKK